MNYPEELMPGLAEVRATGCCNMFDFYCVLTVLRYQGYTDAANWLAGDFCAWIDSHPPLPRESIAQRVARETGLEVIKD
jgi:hypothetical protein